MCACTTACHDKIIPTDMSRWQRQVMFFSGILWSTIWARVQRQKTHAWPKRTQPINRDTLLDCVMYMTALIAIAIFLYIYMHNLNMMLRCMQAFRAQIIMHVCRLSGTPLKKSDMWVARHSKSQASLTGQWQAIQSSDCHVQSWWRQMMAIVNGRHVRTTCMFYHTVIHLFQSRCQQLQIHSVDFLDICALPCVIMFSFLNSMYVAFCVIRIQMVRLRKKCVH